MTIVRLSKAGYYRRIKQTLLPPALILLALSALVSTVYAAGPATGNAKVPKLDTNSLVPGIAKQIEKSGQADVLVVLDDSDARAFAAQKRKALGLKYNNAAITAGRIALLNQKKDTVLSRLSQQNYEIKRNYDHFPVLFMRVNAQSLARLQRMSEVKAISENRILRPLYTDNQNLIEAPRAWDYLGGLTPTPIQPGAGTAVAVVDTGVSYSSGLTTCAASGDPGCISHEECFATDGCTTDVDHGTNVSGIVFQVAPDAEVVALDVFSSDSSNNLYAYDSDILTALNWVDVNYAAYHIVSVNMSLGSGGYSSPCPNDPLSSAISTLRSDGVASAVAAGNGALASSLSLPACAPDAISVGAVYDTTYSTDQNWGICTDATPVSSDQVACFSNSASFLSLLAPGVDVTAEGITMSGTSQATPHVAGSIAVLRSQNGALTVDEEEARLQATGVSITDSKSDVTTSRIDLYDAVSVTAPILVTDPASLDFTSAGSVNPASQTLKIVNGGTGTMNWTVTSDSTWLVPASTSGTGSTDVSVGVNTTGLSAGTYTGNLTVTATDGSGNAVTNSPITIPVTLNVLDPTYEEDFETGDLTKLPWVSWVADSTGSVVPGSWSVEGSTVYDGSYSAQSPAAMFDTDSESGYLQVTLNVTSPGYVYFWLKTDTEPMYDNLKFYVDGTNQGLWTGWSGSTDWTPAQSQIAIGTGVHTFQWVYSKDSTVSDGADAVWLDDIFFPPFNEVSVSPETYYFGAVAAGNTSNPQTFTVTNMSGGSVTLGTLSITGTDSSDFVISNDNCSGHSLGAAGTCTVDVTFTPQTQPVEMSASLSIPENGTSAVTTAALSGSGGQKYNLTIDENSVFNTGTGVVTSSPSGIDCGSSGGACVASFFAGSSITLTPTPDTGSYFAGWTGGGCSGQSPCTITLSADTTVPGTFDTTPPVAGFSGSPLTGPAPLAVYFADESQNYPTSWTWDFGDGGQIYGGQAPEIDPLYVYVNPGTYPVTLTVANAGGSNSLTQSNYVTVTCPAQLASQPGQYSCSIQALFNTASSGDTVEIHDGAVIVESPVLSGGQNLTLRGGYDSSFTTSSGSSTINGSLTIGDGTLTVDGIIIQ